MQVSLKLKNNQSYMSKYVRQETVQRSEVEINCDQNTEFPFHKYFVEINKESVDRKLKKSALLKHVLPLTSLRHVRNIR
jgi:hypothetical protein